MGKKREEKEPTGKGSGERGGGGHGKKGRGEVMYGEEGGEKQERNKGV